MKNWHFANFHELVILQFNFDENSSEFHELLQKMPIFVEIYRIFANLLEISGSFVEMAGTAELFHFSIYVLNALLTTHTHAYPPYAGRATLDASSAHRLAPRLGFHGDGNLHHVCCFAATATIISTASGRAYRCPRIRTDRKPIAFSVFDAGLRSATV